MSAKRKETKKGKRTTSKPLSIFIPIFDEEEIIEKHITLVYNFLREHFTHFELAIVDDASMDNTCHISKKLSNKYGEITYIRYENGPSRRENLAEAMKKAKYHIIAYMDIDLSIPLRFILPLVKAISQGFDICIGSRYLKESKFRRSMGRLLISRIYHHSVRLLFNSKITDYQCGFKAFNKQRLFILLDELGYDKQFVRGWFWDAELLLRAERRKYRIEEIPVFWKAGAKSSFNLVREFKALPYIVKMHLGWKQ